MRLFDLFDCAVVSIHFILKMAFNEQMNDFRAWAASLGCPPDAMPSEDALKSMFKSGHGQFFEQLQNRIKPRQVVQEIRENLLISQMAKHKGKMVPASERKSLPQQLQINLKMQELLKRKEKAQLELAEKKKEYDNLAASIKSKHIQTINAKHRNMQVEAKCNILKLKLESLDKSIEQELETKKQILATMPVKLKAKNASEKLATKAVEQAYKELETFYDICIAEGKNSQQLAEAKSHLWMRMRELFADIPNILIFNAIMKIKEEQLHRIMEMNKTSTNTVSKAPFSKFEIKVLRLKANLLGLVAKHICAQSEVTQLEESFATVYSSFVDELQKKVYDLNGINDTDEGEKERADEIISNYLVQYNTRNFYQARNDFFTEQIEQLRVELEAGTKQLENHDLMLASVKQLYGEINTSVNRIQHDMLQLPQIKEKIIYSKNMLKNLLDDMHAVSQNQTAKSQLLSTKLKVGNLSMLGMESFSLANDSVFTSTRLDIDVDAMCRSFDNTLVPGGITSNSGLASGASLTLPCHLIELNTFAETPLEKLSCEPRVSAFMLSANPLIVDSQELASTIQLAPGHLLTPHGALQEVRKRILWASAIAAHSSDLKFNLEPIIVDPHNLKLKAKLQREELVHLLDNVQTLGLKTQRQLERAKRIYNFILNNPLRQYVPPNKLFNNASFTEYESEFNLYYRMATAGGSIKPKK